MARKPDTYTYQYMGNQVTVPATLVGSMAIYRLGSRWFVAHVATKAHPHKAMPPRFFSRADVLSASKRELVAWCLAWQAANPEYIAMMDAWPTQGQDVHYTPEQHALAARAVESGRAL